MMDESYSKPFLAVSSTLRRCLVCTRVMSVRDSKYHSEEPCEPLPEIGQAFQKLSGSIIGEA